MIECLMSSSRPGLIEQVSLFSMDEGVVRQSESFICDELDTGDVSLFEGQGLHRICDLAFAFEVTQTSAGGAAGRG